MERRLMFTSGLMLFSGSGGIYTIQMAIMLAIAGGQVSRQPESRAARQLGSQGSQPS